MFGASALLKRIHIPNTFLDKYEMASRRNAPLYGQESKETNTISKLVPSGIGIRESSDPREARGDRLELSENNFQLTSISDDSTFPAVDGDTTSLARSADQQVSVPRVSQSTLLPGRGMTVIPTNVQVNDNFFSQTLPHTFNDNGLFGNGSEHCFDRPIHIAYPEGLTNSRANTYSATRGFYPSISQIPASSGQEFVTARSCVPSSASHFQPTIQTAMTTASRNQYIPLYEQHSPQSNARYSAQSAPIVSPRIPLETNHATPMYGTPSAMQTFRQRLPFNDGSPPQGTMSTYPEEGLISIQRGNNRLYSSNTVNNTYDMGNNRQLAEGHQMILATSEYGYEYKLSREQVIKPEFARYEARLATFAVWPHSTYLAPEAVASAGFYLVDQDYTKCFACNRGLHSWQPGDVPIREHAKHYKDCPYVRAVAMEKLLETKGEDFARGEERSLTNVKLTTGRARLSHLGAMGTNPNGCPLLRRAPDPPLPSDSSTAIDTKLYKIYVDLVEMGFAINSVKKSMMKIMNKSSKETGQKELTLDEVLDDLMTTRDVETSEGLTYCNLN